MGSILGKINGEAELTEMPEVRTSQADDIYKPTEKKQSRSGDGPVTSPEELTKPVADSEASGATVAKSGTNGSDAYPGDSVKTTDKTRQQYIRRRNSLICQEWGLEGTLFKIYLCIREGVDPLNVHSLLSRGPIMPRYRRLIAGRCIDSLHKLKVYRIISLRKDALTDEIIHISIGGSSTAMPSKRRQFKRRRAV